LELAVTNLLKFFAYFFDERRPGGFLGLTLPCGMYDARRRRKGLILCWAKEEEKNEQRC